MGHQGDAEARRGMSGSCCVSRDGFDIERVEAYDVMG